MKKPGELCASGFFGGSKNAEPIEGKKKKPVNQ
jgi:hypothetical protein